MIQRIQSLYFSLAILCELLFAFGTKCSGSSKTGSFVYGWEGMVINNELIRSDYKPMFLALIAAVLLIVGVISFKNHKRQLKLAKGFIMIIF
jgi:multidrug transporter EmrE-like cation transporter